MVNGPVPDASPVGVDRVGVQVAEGGDTFARTDENAFVLLHVPGPYVALWLLHAAAAYTVMVPEHVKVPPQEQVEHERVSLSPEK